MQNIAAQSARRSPARFDPLEGKARADGSPRFNDARTESWFAGRRDDFRSRANIPFGGFDYRGDHVRAGIHNGPRGWTAYYYRDRDRHRRYGGHFYAGFNYDPWYWGGFYDGCYYPYGYASAYDVYYHRYPYYYVSAGYYPRWTVWVDPVETVYVESPTQRVVYVESETTEAVEAAPPASETVIVPESSPPPGSLVPQPSTPTPYEPMQPESPGEGHEGHAPPAGDTGSEPGSEPGAETAPPDTEGKVRLEVDAQQRIPVNNAVLADAARAFQEARYEDARAYLARAVLNDPQNGFAELAYALGHFALGDYQAAAAAVRRGVALVPDVIDAPIDVVRQYGEAKDFETHMQGLQLYVASHPEDQNAWFLLGYVRYSSGNPQEAAEAFTKAAGLDPNDTYAAVFRDAVDHVKMER